MNINFSGKFALVTGAGQGIGRCLSRRLHECGAQVFALSRNLSHLKSLQTEVPGVKIIPVDLADWQATRLAVQQIGPIHCLVNNAAVTVLEPFLQTTEDSFDRLFSVNVKAVLNVSQVVAEGMVARGDGGTIVNVSSQCSKVALPEHAMYCSSKAALDMLSAVMAAELGPHKIRVNCVNPTVVMTEMGKLAWADPAKAQPMLDRIPLHRFAEVEDVVDAILYLLSEKSAMINGVCLPVDGGFLAC